jgi:alpha-L-fucosidase 2
MFDLCPPFQIDGNLGGPAAIAEMLVQSTSNEITVLPALPRQWLSGSLKGVRVRGGGKVDITWKEGRLAEFRLRSEYAKKYRISYGDRAAEIQLKAGRPIVLDGGFHEVSQ